jgi:hypothetical protein
VTPPASPLYCEHLFNTSFSHGSYVSPTRRSGTNVPFPEAGPYGRFAVRARAKPIVIPQPLATSIACCIALDRMRRDAAGCRRGSASARVVRGLHRLSKRRGVNRRCAQISKDRPFASCLPSRSRFRAEKKASRCLRMCLMAVASDESGCDSWFSALSHKKLASNGQRFSRFLSLRSLGICWPKCSRAEMDVGWRGDSRGRIGREYQGWHNHAPECIAF